MSKKLFCGASGLLWLTAVASAADSSFLKDAAEGGMMEVKMGELAQSNASSQQVKDFGQRMIKDHGNMGMDVKSLASRENVSLPTDISMKDKAVHAMMSHKTGADFDKAYISDMVKDHKNDIAAFQKEIDTGTDPDAKALAMKAMPKLKEHLRMAQEIASQLGVSQ